MSPQIDITPRSCPDFHIEEFKLLRAEIIADERELSRIQQSCATAAGAIFLWALSRATQGPLPVLFIPFLVSLFGWLRWKVQFESLYTLGGYVKRIEDEYAGPTLLGWEHFLDAKREELKEKKQMTVRQSGVLFWRLLTGVTIIFALLFVPGYL
jgi:hypothetical protein